MMTEQEEKQTYKKRSQVSAVWHRLKKNKLAMLGLIILCVMIGLAVFADFIADYDTVVIGQDMSQRLLTPSLEHLCGTDQFGRDILSRIIYGSRYTIFIGFGCMLCSGLAGVTLGILAAYYPKLDNPIMRFLDVFGSIPDMPLLMCLILIMGLNLRNLLIALAIYYTPGFARITRSKVLSLRTEEYVEASIALGASDRHILIRHILPNAMAPIIVQATLGLAGAILSIAGLSFLGLGIQPPTPEWGAMLSNARVYIRDAWHVTVIPGLGIMLTILSLNLMGDGLRDALDPRLKN